MVAPIFEGKNLAACSHNRLVHLLRRFPQEQGTIQDGITLKDADHKGQAIEVGQTQNRDRFPQCFQRKIAGLQVKFKF